MLTSLLSWSGTTGGSGGDVAPPERMSHSSEVDVLLIAFRCWLLCLLLRFLAWLNALLVCLLFALLSCLLLSVFLMFEAGCGRIIPEVVNLVSCGT